MKKFLLFLLFAIGYLLFATNVFAAQKTCPSGESRYRPGGECERTVPAVESSVADYPLTCQDVPLAKLNGDSIFPVSIGDIFTRTITADISQAELGGLGPDSKTIASYSQDALAQIYPFNGLFDRPLSLKDQPREASRTYWRLLSAYQQANAKAAYIRLVRNNPTVNNNSIPFYNPDKQTPTPTPTGGAIGNISSSLGINIGYGHIDQKFCADAAGRPVTFLVDLNADESSLRSFQNCYATASLRIVRIKNFTSFTSQADFSAAGTRFAAVFDSDYLVLGNELNALDTEYPCSSPLSDCGLTYTKQFNAFKSTFTGPNLSAAPMNTSNPVYDAAKFLDGAKQAYQNSTFLAENAYQSSAGCAYDPIRCAKDSYKWTSQYLGLNKPIILTEYGLAPGNDDRNLENVLAFYQSLPTDVLAITPLIRNVCIQAAGEWLHFNKQNQLVDLDGKVVDPATCGAAGDLQANDSLTVLKLADKLPGCLTKYPVCDNFAQEYLDLSSTTQIAYDALLPFNFDNLRGYQILNDIIYRENLPYVRAIADGLNNSRSGLLNLLSPAWINDLRADNLKTNSENSNTLSPLLELNLARKALLLARSKLLNKNDCFDHDNSTYLPSPFTYPEDSRPLSQDVDIVVSNVTRRTGRDPLTGRVTNRYKYSGEKEGQPIVVLNNPKLEDLNLSLQGPQSLAALFTPGAGDPPDRDMTAPIANLSANDDDTKVEGETWQEGQARIGRTSGQATTSLCELRNRWLIPAGLQKANVDCVDPFQTLGASVQGPGVSIPIPEQANCDASAPSGDPGNLLPVENLMNIGFPSGASKENMQKCYNDLVSRSNAAGYDPALVMAIWLEESAASWYGTYPDSADFGCAVNTARMDFSAQIGCFLRLKNSYANGSQWQECRGSDDQLSLREFFLIFEGGYQSCRAGEFTIEPQFPDRIKNYYSLVTGGKTLDFSAPPP